MRRASDRAFHTYSVEWLPDSISWFIDDTRYLTLTPGNLPTGAPWVFDHPFFMPLNLAVGGSWPGDPDASTTFPQQLTPSTTSTSTAPPAPGGLDIGTRSPHVRPPAHRSGQNSRDTS
jgi:beta-glucanase (GH16 family)